MKTASWFAAACVITFATGCNRTPAAPTSPTTVAAGDENAAPDGSTLKVNAPGLVSPINNLRLEGRRPTMVITNAQGRFANVPYTYEFQLMNDAGNVIRSTTIAQGANNTQWGFPDELERDTPYRWRARATASGAVGPWSATGRFITVKENRTPDPDPNSICFDASGNLVRNCIPPPNGFPIIQQVVNANPGILSLRRSCQEPQWGGDHIAGWEFLDKVIDALRLTDTRWGYNGKRGNPGDPSLDVIAYHYGPGPDEGSREVWVWDVVLSHCGDAQPGWSHITNIYGSGAVWISRGRF